MTDDRFDDLTKQLTGASSRRGILKGTVALAIGGLATRFGAQRADARARIHIACAREGRQCSTEPGAGGALTCCPHLVCDEFTGVCGQPTQTCAPGTPIDQCGPDVMANCGPEGVCGTVINVDGGCACIERTCTEIPCTSGADCKGGLCVQVPTCCGESVSFCANPCGDGQLTPASIGARQRVRGVWQR